MPLAAWVGLRAMACYGVAVPAMPAKPSLPRSALTTLASLDREPVSSSLVHEHFGTPALLVLSKFLSEKAIFLPDKYSSSFITKCRRKIDEARYYQK